jgi:hypothetical protein
LLILDSLAYAGTRLGEKPIKRGSKMVRPGDIRKPNFNVFFHQSFAINVYFFLIIFFFMSPIASSAGNKANLGDELISLTAKDEPLEYVLKKISMATGYEIVLDNDWRGCLVSVTLEKVPLDKGLKRILKDLNNVIVYVSSKKIKIIIYDKVSPEAVSPAPSNEKALISPGRSYAPPSREIPDSQALENEEASPDNPGVSGEESEIGASGNAERKKKILENFKKRTNKRRSEQNDQSEPSSGEETERSQKPEGSGNNE